jgi:mannose-1-phosphate guanylyltransferase/mannose-6-phosphate isomerase
MKRYSVLPVIMCGGSGTRLWPLSRQRNPKQFLKLFGSRSLFQDTVLRASQLRSTLPPLIVANASHGDLVVAELAELGAEGARIMLEPVGRNTAPALATAALHAKGDRSDILLLALPADHYMRDAVGLNEALERGIPAAQKGSMVVFGVPPTEAHTGYGYIRKDTDSTLYGTYRVTAFKEKPDSLTAAAYVSSGQYLWNSGMFLVRADVYLRELQQHAPDILAAAVAALLGAKHAVPFIMLDPTAFAACPSDSIDYAVMEHTDIGRVVELAAGWSDVGAWPSVLEAGARDSDLNLISGDVLLRDVSGSIVHSSGRLVAAIGLQDHLVVETADAVLVAPLERAQDVKQLVMALQQQGRPEAEGLQSGRGSWGSYECLARVGDMQLGQMKIKPGTGLPGHRHQHRSEHWVVMQGVAEAVCAAEVVRLQENDSIHIPVNTDHQLRNVGSSELRVVELRSGSRLGEDDTLPCNSET